MYALDHELLKISGIFCFLFWLFSPSPLSTKFYNPLPISRFFGSLCGVPKVPPNVNFFACTAALSRILTNDKLEAVSACCYWMCCMCKRAGENINHLLSHCPITRELWSMVFTLSGVFWVMPKGIVEHKSLWNICRVKEVLSLESMGSLTLKVLAVTTPLFPPILLYNSQ